MKWLLCLAAGICLHFSDPLMAQELPASSVRCTAANDARHREFLLDRAEGRWRLSMRSEDTGRQWIRLPLPSAAPEFATGVARLAYKNANGGRQVDLTVTPTGSTLDVWVDHGLEVNIEPDLDPRVDRMNTEGPLASIACEVHTPSSG